MRRNRLALVAAIAAPALVVVAGPATLAAASTTHAAHPAQVRVPTATAAVPASLLTAAEKAGSTPVIVLLKGGAGVAEPDTSSNHTRHAAALAAEQAPVLSTLRALHAARVHAYGTFGEVSATVDATTLQALAAQPSVAEILPDAAIPVSDTTASLRGALNAAGATGTTGTTLPAGVCSADPTKPQLNPQALQTTDTDSDDPTAKTARSLGATGAGVKVAFFAEGIDVNNPDFIRPDGSKVFVDYQDFSGDGTAAPTSAGEAFLDASSIAAQGNEVYNVKNYGPLAPSTACYIRVEGVAPGASLVGMKIFGNTVITTSGILQAIDYAVNVDHVDILSQSLGSNPIPDTADDAFRQADAAAVAAGVTVVASSGDAGVTSTIGSPSDQPGVISAGASTTYRIDLQDGYGGARFPGVKGYLNNNISSLSSGGTTESGTTDDIVAPGELNWALCTPDPAQYADCVNYLGEASPVEASGGTSESAPLTAGGAALVIQAYRQTHGGASPSPALVKEILVSTATDISAPGDQQGAGELDTYQAVLAARSIPAGRTSGAQGSTFLESTGQISAVAAPGTPVSKAVTITNTGTGTETIGVSTRTLGAYSTIATGSVVLSAHSPTNLDWTGFLDPYEVIHFRVPAGRSRLDAEIDYQGASTSLNARGRLTLIDPNGDLAAYSLPQGVGNHGDVQVANPVGGAWTAYVYSKPAAGGGSLGTYHFRAGVANYHSYGSVSASSLTLAAGHSGTVTFTTSTPATPGDKAASIVLSSPQAGTTTIPVIVRSLAAVSGPASSFRGVLLGGNGREYFNGQTEYYQLVVPAGAPELNATVTLATNPNNPFAITLVDPHGDAVGSASNRFEPTQFGAVTPEIAATANVLAPEPGIWDVVLVFAPTVSGIATAEGFTVAFDDHLQQATASGLPQSTSVTLPAGRTQLVTVHIKNTTAAPVAYFVDGRRNYYATYPLAGLIPNPLTLPDASYVQVYLVPTDTIELDESLSSTVPIAFDTDAPTGDPDPEAISSGKTASLTYSAVPVSSGYWGQFASEVGPYGAVGAPQVQATASATVRTLDFDRALTSSTGDLYSESTGAGGVDALVVAPGKTGTITVAITPNGKPGATVNGTLFVDDLQLQTDFAEEGTANQVTALPYSYTIG